jgi:hypothetical protein
MKCKVGRPRIVDVTTELTNLLEELDIQMVSTLAYRGPGATMAIGCLRRIFQQRGYGHTKLVLMSIAETRTNGRELVAPVIWAVSDLIVAHPEWAERVTDWLAAFDKVDLKQLRVFARQNKSAVKPRAAIATLLFGFLASKMDQPQESGPLKRPARRMAA